MSKNPVLNVPLNEVIRADIALPLQHVLRVYTVGGLLSAWKNPRNHKSIEQVFESPEQAHHAVSVCAAFLGIQTQAVTGGSVPQWWASDQWNSMADVAAAGGAENC